MYHLSHLRPKEKEKRMGFPGGPWGTRSPALEGRLPGHDGRLPTLWSPLHTAS